MDQLDNEALRLKRFYEAELGLSADLRRTLEDDEAVVEGDLWRGAQVDWTRQRTMPDLNLVRQTIRVVAGLANDQAGEALVLPAQGGQQGHEDMAQADATVKGHILKHHERACAARYHFRQAIAQAAACGISWLHDMNYAFGGRGGADAIFKIEKSHEDWRYIVWDTNFRKPDFSDGRYLFHHRFVDLDAAKKMYAGKDKVLDSSATMFSAYRDIYGPMTDTWGATHYGGPTGGDIWGADRDTNYAGGFSGTEGMGGRRDGVWIVRAWWRDYIREQGQVRDQVYYRDFVISGSRGAWHSLTQRGEWHFIPFTPILYSIDPSTGWPRGLAYDMKEVCRQFNLTVGKMMDSANSKSLQAEIGAIEPMFADRPDMTGEDKVRELEWKLARSFSVLLFANGALQGKTFNIDHNTAEFKQGMELANLMLNIAQSGVNSINSATLGQPVAGAKRHCD